MPMTVSWVIPMASGSSPAGWGSTVVTPESLIGSPRARAHHPLKACRGAANLVETPP
jgi:hypothetical protein